MLQLNLGAGDVPVAGFESRDGKQGDVLYPLPDADQSVASIRASHVLEHFPHGDVLAVLRDWVRVVQPGGLVQIAVPDHAKMRNMTAGQAQGFLMGGQIDERDFHKTLFDETLLSQCMRAAGLVAIRRWTSEVSDCAALPVSLNLCGNKPAELQPKVAAVVSVPRLGFNDFWGFAQTILPHFDIPLRKTTGAYWDRSLTQGMDESIEEYHPDWILTCDYDSIFTEAQIADLLSIASRYPHADAIAPLQTARWHNAPMFTLEREDGTPIGQIEREPLVEGELIRAKSAHFGLTLLRCSALATLPKPWFARSFTVDGLFEGEGAQDPDVHFWHNWKAAGHSLYVALRVPIGHAELMVRWPDLNLEAIHQLPGDFNKSGPPANLWR